MRRYPVVAGAEVRNDEMVKVTPEGTALHELRNPRVRRTVAHGFVIALGLGAAVTFGSACSALPGPVVPGPGSGIATVVIETPAGSGIAYEVNECSRRLGVRTVAAGGHTFPVNAGYVPGTLDPRRGPLGVMVLVPDPIPAGATIRARVVGVVRLRNGRGEAPRLLMVPSETVDPASSGIRSVSGIDPLELEKVEAFFTANGYSFEGFGDDLEGRVLLDRARRAADGDPDAACVPW
jgi:inorganic pyrophosphatase